MSRTRTLALLLSLVLGATSVAAMTTLSREDGQFVVDASMAGLFELEASRVALEKTESDDVEALASTLVQDHSMANAKLAELADMKGVAVPQTLDKGHAAQLKDLDRRKAGPDFDAAYVAAMEDGHAAALKLFSTASREARDRDLKQFVAKTLPTLEMHGRSVALLEKKQQAH